jgi:hypothetical protein
MNTVELPAVPLDKIYTDITKSKRPKAKHGKIALWDSPTGMKKAICIRDSVSGILGWTLLDIYQEFKRVLREYSRNRRAVDVSLSWRTLRAEIRNIPLVLR